MKTLPRYCLVVVLALFIACNVWQEWRERRDLSDASTFWRLGDEASMGMGDEATVHGSSRDECTMHRCFDWKKCVDGEEMKVYVYPDNPQHPPSELYSKILTAIRESVHYTSDPKEACLFVLSLDTVDRDKISDNYVSNLDDLIAALPQDVWNGGRNHILFTLYHGTYPDYADHRLGYDVGEAVVARASASVQHFRSGFDISFPLFHKEHPIRNRVEREFSLRDRDAYLVSFKGKRYVYGIGSETRDSLHHIHSDDVPMVTTCKHNNDWQAHQDSRCERDNQEYDKWDYESMMANSTFCLTPRGRRLGSFRFLESLRLGCIPVVLSDDWVLPFSEWIDWSAAAVSVDEKSVLLVPSILRSIPSHRVIEMRMKAREIYTKYFQDVHTITLTALNMMWDRIRVAEGHDSLNRGGGEEEEEEQSAARFSVLIRASERVSGRLQKTVAAVAALDGIADITILWPASRGSAPLGADFGTSRQPEIRVVDEPGWHLESFRPSKERTLLLDERVEEVGKEELSSLLSASLAWRGRMIGIHGLDVQVLPSGVQVTHSSIYNALFLSATVVESPLLSALASSFSSQLLRGCSPLLLSILSPSPPILIQAVRGELSKGLQREITLYEECARQLSPRYPSGLPLIYSDWMIYQ